MSPTRVLPGPDRDSGGTLASGGGEKRAMARRQIVNVDKALCWNGWPEYCCVFRNGGQAGSERHMLMRSGESFSTLDDPVDEISIRRNQRGGTTNVAGL